jgi:hypothetical protein
MRQYDRPSELSRNNGLHSRIDERRVVEVNVAVNVLNRMLDLGRPNYVRIV